MPEITKLNLLNHFLGIEDLPVHDKLHLIYEKILEELNESVAKHHKMLELDQLLHSSEADILSSRDSLKLLSHEMRILEREKSVALLRQMELKGDYKRLKEENAEIGNSVELRQEELTQLLSKEI